MTNDKVSYLEKLVFRSGVRFFLFILTDAILIKLDLQKRTSVLGNPPNEKLYVYKKWQTYRKIGDALFFSYIKATIGQCDLVGRYVYHQNVTYGHILWFFLCVLLMLWSKYCFMVIILLSPFIANVWIFLPKRLEN